MPLRSEFVTSDNQAKGEGPEYEESPRNFMSISESIVHRLQTGIVSHERLKDYDENWMNKLSEMERNHTAENNLDISEAHRILQTLSDYSSDAIVTSCPVDKSKLIECYTMMKGDTLRCEEEVKDFVDTIDKLMYKASHLDKRSISSACSKKMSYRERFEKNCLR